MLHRHLILVFLWIGTISGAGANPPASAQYSLQRANELMDGGNPLLIEGYLRAWSAASPREIDLFVAKFNVDYQRSAETASDSLYAVALSHLNTAVGIQPRRLDLWLKTIFALNQRGFYADQGDLMLILIDRSDRFGHDWLWEGDVPLEESQTVFLMTMHEHLSRWVGLSRPPIAEIRRVSERLQASFPEDGMSVATVGVSHLLEGNASLGLPHLIRATELEPRDGAIWFMLATAREADGDTAGAIAAYERVMELGDDDQKQSAASRLAALR
jgi:tetratricopeptide (TPR) repeat protein